MAMNEQHAYLSVFAQKEAQRFKLKAGVFLFLVQNEHILLLKRAKTGIDDGNYVVPMGGVEGNETLTDALIREAFEEANIQLAASDIRMCHLMHRYHRMPQNLSFEQLDIYFYADHYQGEVYNREPHKCAELSWHPLDNLPSNTVSFIRHALEAMKKGHFYSEYGW